MYIYILTNYKLQIQIHVYVYMFLHMACGYIPCINVQCCIYVDMYIYILNIEYLFYKYIKYCISHIGCACMTCIQQHIDPSGMHRDLWPPTNRRTRTTRLARAPTRAVLVNTGDSLAKKPAPRLRINTSSCTRNEETKHHSTWIFDPRVFVTIL